MTKTTKVAIYARSSVADRLERQLPALRTFASASGWQAIEYSDVGRSTSVGDRLGLATLLIDAETHGFTTVFCMSLDKLSRTYSVTLRSTCRVY